MVAALAKSWNCAPHASGKTIRAVIPGVLTSGVPDPQPIHGSNDLAIRPQQEAVSGGTCVDLADSQPLPPLAGRNTRRCRSMRESCKFVSDELPTPANRRVALRSPIERSGPSVR
jgi:hypothetical protein